MSVNQQNVSVVTQFNKVPSRFFLSGAGVAPGAATFIAAVLCRVQPESTGATRVLMGNYDSVNDLGWQLDVDDQGDTGQQLSATVGEGGAVSETLAVLVGPHVNNKLMLVHVGANEDNYLRIYVNGGLVADVAPASPPQPSAGLFGLGANGDGTNPAIACEIAGAAYTELSLSAAALDTFVTAHFDACYRAMNMSYGGQTAPGPSAFINRWDAREGVSLPGAAGVYDAATEALVQFPATQAIWTASDGNDDLTRQGPAPTPAAPFGGVAANVITNPVWATTPIIVGVVPAPP